MCQCSGQTLCKCIFTCFLATNFVSTGGACLRRSPLPLLPQAGLPQAEQCPRCRLRPQAGQRAVTQKPTRLARSPGRPCLWSPGRPFALSPGSPFARNPSSPCTPSLGSPFVLNPDHPSLEYRAMRLWERPVQLALSQRAHSVRHFLVPTTRADRSSGRTTPLSPHLHQPRPLACLRSSRTQQQDHKRRDSLAVLLLGAVLGAGAVTYLSSKAVGASPAVGMGMVVVVLVMILAVTAPTTTVQVWFRPRR